MSWDRMVVYGIAFVLVVITVVIVAQNRGLDQLWDKAIPSIIIGLLSFISLIWISPEIKDKIAEIPAIFFYNKSSYEPFDFLDVKEDLKNQNAVILSAMPRWPMNDDGLNLIPKRLVRYAKSKKIQVGDNKDPSKEILFYLDVLEYLIVSNFADKFANSWQVDWPQSDWSYLTRSVGVSEVSSIVNDCTNFINHTDLILNFKNNKLLETAVDGKKLGFCIPPQINFTTSNPSSGERWMLFKNSFITLKIEIVPNISSIGWGMLGEFIGIDFNNAYQASYKIKYFAYFNKNKKNHPDMKKYEQWAQKVLDSLEEFNYNVYWGKMEKWQILRSSLNK